MKKRLYICMLIGFLMGFLFASHGFSLQHTSKLDLQRDKILVESTASPEATQSPFTVASETFAPDTGATGTPGPAIYPQGPAIYPQAPFPPAATSTPAPTPEPTATPAPAPSKREQVLVLAKSYVQKIHYLWGGKCKDSDIEGKTKPTSLDCSGFIQFIYSKVEGERINQLGSTIAIANLEKIHKKELKPGDIGLKRGTGSLYYDAKGKAYPAPSLAERANARLLRGTIHKIVRTKKSIKKLKNICEKKQEFLLEQKIEINHAKEDINETSIAGAEQEKLDAVLNEDEEVLVEQKRQIHEINQKVKDLTKRLKKLRMSRRTYEEDITKRIDHVGIYCGTDKKGNEIWCHCSSAQHGVVWEKTDIFKWYFRYYGIK